jgi:hypothetical protein
MITPEKSKADANPTKAFFVRMITRDITLEDCIFDLIDNSVDGAWQQAGGHSLTLNDNTDLSHYMVKIFFAEDEFSIIDNCGGISLDDAVAYAFTFGRRETATAENFSIGVYGIGMKRAVFKIGSDILIRSTYKRNGAAESFQVPINVGKWLEDTNKDWDFDIEEADKLDAPGVDIRVRELKLNEGAKRSFGSPLFLRNLRRAVSRDYALHLHRGLNISLNGEKVIGWDIQLRKSEEFKPMRADFVEELDDGRVDVEILAGMGAAPPDSLEPADGDQPENRWGWYVVCNGRVVVAADKTTVSGWGTEGWPQWHPQYAGF